MMKRKQFATLIAITIMLVIPHTAEAYDFSATSSSGHTLYYNIVNNGVEVVMNYGDFPLGNLVIPSSVTYDDTTYTVVGIGQGAFWTVHTLTGTIILPNTITYIGDLAFYRCYGILSLEIPSSVTSIGFRAFEGVNNVVYTGNLHDSANWYAKTLNGYIENGLVYTDSTKTVVTGCDHTLSSYTIPSSASSLGPMAFHFHPTLAQITIPEGVTTIGNTCFANCGMLTSITMPTSITNIGMGAFAGDTLLPTLIIPANVSHIGCLAFQMCYALDTLNMLGSTPPLYDTLMVEYYDDGDSSVWHDNYTMVDMTINVPCHAGTAYSSAAGWSMCNNIVDPCEDNPNSIGSATQSDITVTTCNGAIVVQGAVEGTMLTVYDMMGRLFAIITPASTQCTITVPYTGVYIVKVDNQAAHKVVVIR